MSKTAVKPLLVFMWLGNVDRLVAAEHLYLAGKISSADADDVRRAVKFGDSRYLRRNAGADIGFGKIQPLAALLGKSVEYHVLSDHDSLSTGLFREWLASQGFTVVVHTVPLRSASDYEEVFSRVDAVLNEVSTTRSRTECEYGFYLTPGTRAMASVLLLQARTRFDARVFHWAQHDEQPSSVDIPFDLSLRFMPDVEARRAAARVLLRRDFPTAALADIVGDSLAITKAKQKAALFAARPSNVLLIGPTGCGKERFANCIHKASARESRPFVAVNCAAVSDTLFESEMFGYKKGSNSVATGDKDGLMQKAHKGTLFLDEVGELGLDQQAALLRALQPVDDSKPTLRYLQPLGATADELVDVRIIAATNRDLCHMVKQGTFREDLLHRLDCLTIHIPSLEDRKEDIPSLIQHILDNINSAWKNEHPQAVLKSLMPEAVKVLQARAWPGNVRQLQAVLARAHAEAAGDDITAEDIAKAVDGGASRVSEAKPILDRPLGCGFILKVVEAEFRAQYILRACAEAESLTHAAGLLGYDNAQTFSNQLESLVEDTTLQTSLRDGLRKERDRLSSRRARRAGISEQRT